MIFNCLNLLIFDIISFLVSSFKFQVFAQRYTEFFFNLVNVERDTQRRFTFIEFKILKS